MGTFREQREVRSTPGRFEESALLVKRNEKIVLNIVPRVGS